MGSFAQSNVVFPDLITNRLTEHPDDGLPAAVGPLLGGAHAARCSGENVKEIRGEMWTLGKWKFVVGR